MSHRLQTTRWAFDLSTWPAPTITQLAEAVAAVQPEERARLMKFVFINDFLSSLVGRLLMRKYVSDCSGLEYHEVKFARDDRGKPYWIKSNSSATSTTQLSFNVSHQGNYVILAGVHNVCRETPQASDDFGVGCDVMKVEYSGGKDLREFFRIMHRKFADSEWRYIAQTSFNEREQIKAFMRHWCLKESYVKELGVGITIDLQKLAFTADTSQPLSPDTSPLTGATLSHNNISMDDWSFEEHMLDSKYCAAIAFRNCRAQRTEKFCLLDVNELLRPSPVSETSDIIKYCREVMKKQYK